jgi:hypothetical protein
VRVRNVHVRELAAPPAAVGALIDGLASDDDRLWPRERWPAMRLDRPLTAGASGGHGPVRYSVESYVPGAAVCFRFTAPRGFCGTHRFEVDARRGGGSLLRHVLEMSAVGPARLTWPLIFRPLHDALVEDALDRAAGALGEAPRGRSWPFSVRVLRRGAVGWRRFRPA